MKGRYVHLEDVLHNLILYDKKQIIIRIKQLRIKLEIDKKLEKNVFEKLEKIRKQEEENFRKFEKERLESLRFKNKKSIEDIGQIEKK